MYHIAIPSAADRYLDWCHVLAPINSNAMDIAMHVSFGIMVFLHVYAQEWDSWVI